jgi:hypothetical protein
VTVAYLPRTNQVMYLPFQCLRKLPIVADYALSDEVLLGGRTRYDCDGPIPNSQRTVSSKCFLLCFDSRVYCCVGDHLDAVVFRSLRNLAFEVTMLQQSGKLQRISSFHFISGLQTTLKRGLYQIPFPIDSHSVSWGLFRRNMLVKVVLECSCLSVCLALCRWFWLWLKLWLRLRLCMCVCRYMCLHVSVHVWQDCG